MHARRRRFGQHFLIDELVIRDIVALLVPRPGDHVVEIGPGAGALTAPLVASGLQLDVIEIDRDLAARLVSRFGEAPNLRIHTGDALDFDIDALQAPGQVFRVVGNLPYNISTPLLLKFLMHLPHPPRMLFMLQKEVVDRLAARPGNRDYGRLTVIAQYLCEVEAHFDVEPESFAPPPRVRSSVVSLSPRPAPFPPVDLAWLSEIVRRAFAQRRKTLRNTLGRFLGPGVLEHRGIDPSSRAEELTVEDYAHLAARGRPAAT